MTETKGQRPFDGVICIGGEDWWYHNRGHFDFQIMRRIARQWPVLFVNSLGVRMPSLERKDLFLKKIGRKLKSLKQGAVHVENAFWVFSPFMVPGATGQRLTDWALAPQIRLAAARAGIRRPLLWMHCPAGAPLMDRLGAAGIVMQRTDRFEAFPEGDPLVLGRQVQSMKQRAELVIYAAPHLADEERGSVQRSLVVTHGVDLDKFTEAGMAPPSDPADMAAIPHQRVGFIGGIDAHTFDPAMFLAAVRAMPEVSFVMVGGSSLSDGWCPYPNVHFLGRKPYDEVARYMAAMDVLIMPWNRSDWIKACNPVKLKEYLAVGRPVVTTDFAALDPWRDLVRVASDADGFVRHIRAALKTPTDPAVARRRLASETWDVKAGEVMQGILDLGLCFAPNAVRNTHPAAPALSAARLIRS